MPSFSCALNSIFKKRKFVPPSHRPRRVVRGGAIKQCQICVATSVLQMMRACACMGREGGGRGEGGGEGAGEEAGPD